MGQPQPIRALMLEDVPTDAELIERELRGVSGGVVTRRVSSEPEFLQALHTFAPQVILADYKLPAFDGFSALAIARERAPGVPFIFVTGAMGEEFAIDTLHRGATDYVLKDRLSKLVPAVERALREAEAGAQRRKAEAELRERLDEVERLNRVMVGRELRMVQLKKENAALRQRVEELERQLSIKPDIPDNDGNSRKANP